MVTQRKGGLLFVTPWLRDGGIERVIQTTVPWLAARGFRCEVASWHVSSHLSGRPNPVLASLAAASVPVRRLRSFGRFRLVQRAVQAAAFALRGRLRLLVGYELEGNLVALIAKRLLLGRARVMAQTHNASRIHDEVGTSAALLRLARRLYRDADVMLAPSEAVRQDALRFFGLEPGRIVTTYNPLPVGRIREMAKQEIDPALPTRGPFIVGCGRLVKMKGFPDLLDAFAAVRSERALRLVILGEGPARSSLVEHARHQGVLDDVIMPGFATNPWSYFARSHAFVLSSRFGEAFPMVLVEAMACGAPVIASRCEWGPEEILERGEHGLLYEPGDIETLSAHLRTVLDSPALASRLSAAASRRAEQFSQDAILPAFERHVEALLS